MSRNINPYVSYQPAQYYRPPGQQQQQQLLQQQFEQQRQLQQRYYSSDMSESDEECLDRQTEQQQLEQHMEEQRQQREVYQAQQDQLIQYHNQCIQRFRQMKIQQQQEQEILQQVPQEQLQDQYEEQQQSQQVGDVPPEVYSQLPTPFSMNNTLQSIKDRICTEQFGRPFSAKPHTLIAVPAHHFYPEPPVIRHHTKTCPLLSPPNTATQQAQKLLEQPIPSGAQYQIQQARSQQKKLRKQQPVITVTEPGDSKAEVFHQVTATAQEFAEMHQSQRPSKTQQQRQQQFAASGGKAKENQRSTTHVKQGSKKYPITVGTPKYYRRPPPSTNLYRRPSALCLPLATQPDPASIRKPKKSSEGTPQQQQELCADKKVVETVKKYGVDLQPRKMESGDVVDFSSVNLDEMLEQIEADTWMTKDMSKGDITKMSKFLKPRIPASVKLRQQKQQKKEAKAATERDQKSGNQVEIHEVTADSLERLLKQLQKCEFSSSAAGKEDAGKTDGKSKKKTKNKVKDNGRATDATVTDDEGKKNTVHSPTKSYNYQDITAQMVRNQNELKSFCDSAPDSISSLQNMGRKIKETVSQGSGQKSSVSMPKVPPLDDMCALELHRSKSYIVDLIDRALSKELGTVPSGRGRREVFDHMTPRKAIQTVNRHQYMTNCAKSPKEISMEITSTLTDSILSTATAPHPVSDTVDVQAAPSTTASGKTCCSCGAEEPTYIRQLKQLRWGHLRHIQREVRRLEDLERFLDTCSITTIPET